MKPKKKSENTLRQVTMKNILTKIYETKTVLRGKLNDIGLPQETRKFQINNLTYHLKHLGGEQNPKSPG